MGSLYKLLAKVNGLKKVMHKLINKAQNAFVEGRKTDHGCFFVGE